VWFSSVSPGETQRKYNTTGHILFLPSHSQFIIHTSFSQLIQTELLSCEGAAEWNRKQPSAMISNSAILRYLDFIKFNCTIKPLKPKIFQVIFYISFLTSKRTPHFIIGRINWLMPFKEITAVFSEKHTKSISTK
jgi:hypothetical protein